MKDWINIFFRIMTLIVAVVCAVTAVVSFYKGDPMHIPLAYAAGAWLYLEISEKDFL